VKTMRTYGFLAALAVLALSACGGGSPSSFANSGTGTGSSGASSSGATTTTYRIGNGSGTTFANGVVGLSNNSVSAGGTASLSVTVVDQTGTLYTAAPVTVTFNSPCVSQGLATITASAPSTVGPTAGTVVTASGNATATYIAKGCSGADVVTATALVGKSALTATTTVTVAAATVGSIQFVSATPTTIGLKGTGLGETSTVIFKVVDSTGGARPGASVSFSLNTTVGGMSISPATGTSAADGTVQTVVSSGTQHTSVRVTATIASPALSTQSSVLTVTTGIPSSNGFSIAVGAATYGGTASTFACPNVEAYDIDGVSVPVTVRLADRYNNPAPDGTAVAFTTDGGHVVGSCTTPSGPTSPGDGTCTATWTSANPRPQLGDDNPPLRGKGRATILATAIGEESFTDTNGNGFWDSGEPFVNLGEPFRDDNENNAYDSGEYFLDFNKNGVRDAGDGTFKGITCSGTTCSTSTLAIGANHLIIMSSSAAAVAFVSATGFAGNGAGLTIVHSTSGSVTINVADTNGNSMAAGTKVVVSADASAGTLTQTPNPFVIGCNAGVGGQNTGFSFTAAGTPASGNITIQVISPNGTDSVFTIPVTVT
jgi:hypothetical protein